MTLAALRPWILPGVAAAFALWGVRGCNRLGEARATLAQERERYRLERAGQEVVQPALDLAPQVATLERENAVLKAALDAARKAAPGARPVSVVHASTGPVISRHPATSERATAAAPLLDVVPAPATHSGEGATCLLHDGDAGEIRVDTVELQAKAGTRVLVGAAAAYRLNPDLRLFGGPFSAPLTDATEKAPPAPETGRWAVGPLVGMGAHGPLAGGLLATPEARFLGLRISALALGAAGAGDALVMGGVMVRP